jgi:hypothetical protein
LTGSGRDITNSSIGSVAIISQPPTTHAGSDRANHSGH